MLTLQSAETSQVEFTEFQVIAPLGTANIVVQNGGSFWGIHFVTGDEDSGFCQLLGQHPIREDAECMGRMIAQAVELALMGDKK